MDDDLVLVRQKQLPATSSYTHLTSAALRGWWLPPLPDELPVFIALPTSSPRPRRAGVHVTRHPRVPAWEEHRGVRCATPAETLLACARDLTLLDLLVLVDSALHRGDVTPEELRTVARLRRRGAPLVRRALPLADPRSESAWETLLRLLHVVLGIEVEPQHEVYDDEGRFVARGDLWLPGTTTFHEYDGSDHRRKQQQRRDLKRERRLGHVEWTRRGYTDQEVLHQAVSILRDADHSLGRPHDPSRVRAWNRLLRESCFTPAGLARLSRRLGLAVASPSEESGQSVAAIGPDPVRQ